ncbi:MAG: M1 family aminopeptidase [Candidatus Kapaibacterium sp.]
MFYLLIILTLMLSTIVPDASAQTIATSTPIPTATILHIALDLKIDLVKRQAVGTATLRCAINSPTSSISLDAGMLSIESVTLPDGTALKFTYDGGDRDGGLEIDLNRVYNAKENITLIVRYHTKWMNATDPYNLAGSNGKGIRFLGGTPAEPRKKTQVWTSTEPGAARYWYPCHDTPNALHTSELRITVERPMIVVASGRQGRIEELDGGTRAFSYHQDLPHASHQLAFVIGDYALVQQETLGVKLLNYCYPDEVEATRASVERLPDMMKFFADYTSVKYPYPSYSQVFVQDIPWGMPTGGMATQTENMIDDEGTHADFLYLWDGLEGESLAQQWFGGTVASADWGHCWLTKAFAKYFSEMYAEYKIGREEFLLYQHGFDLSTDIFDASSGTAQPVVHPKYGDATAFTNSNAPYFRGAAVLHLLRKHLGDERFRKGIRYYLKSNEGRLVTTKNFQRAIEESTGESLDWFFNQWVYGVGHPKFTVTQEYDTAKQQLILILQQTQVIDTAVAFPQVKYFQGKMDIAIDNEIHHVSLAPKADNVFVVDLPQPPKLITIDYESAWIKEISFAKSNAELIYQLHHDTDITGRQSALTELTARAKKEASDSVKMEIYAALREEITGKSYWRFRFNALGQLQSLLAPMSSVKPVTLDAPTTEMLLSLIKTETSWIRATAIRFLGMTADARYVDLYRQCLADPSDRVVNTAAIALGKTKNPAVYDILVQLIKRPSWKNQSLISALNGFKELADLRAYDIAAQALLDLDSPRWTLATPIWDFRLAAAETIVSFKKSAAIYPAVAERLRQALKSDDLNVVFNTVLILTTLADPRTQELYDMLKVHFKDNENALQALQQYEAQFKEVVAVK